MTHGPRAALKPTLGLLDATAIGVGAIIGAGIFVVTGIAAAHAGSAVVVSMVIAAAISLLTALSFAELTAWMPKEGSVYELARRLVSPFVGFLTGWMWIVSNTFGGAAVSLGFAYYFTAVVPGVPARWLAASVCIAFAALNHFGVRASAVFNNALVLAKLLVLMLFCFLGVLYVHRANFTPFDPASLGVLSGASYIFFAYGGFARVAVIAEEVKEPERNVPRAILLSLAISTAFYGGGRARGRGPRGRLQAVSVQLAIDRGDPNHGKAGGRQCRVRGRDARDRQRAAHLGAGCLARRVCDGPEGRLPRGIRPPPPDARHAVLCSVDHRRGDGGARRPRRPHEGGGRQHVCAALLLRCGQRVRAPTENLRPCLSSDRSCSRLQHLPRTAGGAPPYLASGLAHRHRGAGGRRFLLRGEG